MARRQPPFSVARYGRVRVKTGGASASPEFEDCRTIAQASGVSLKEIMSAAIAAYRKDRP